MFASFALMGLVGAREQSRRNSAGAIRQVFSCGDNFRARKPDFPLNNTGATSDNFSGSTAKPELDLWSCRPGFDHVAGFAVSFP